MSDLKLRDFRERAERGIALPDLADLERRGHGLRRRRVASGVGALALALVAGGAIALGTGDRTTTTPPPIAETPSPTPTTAAPDARWAGVRKVPVDHGEELYLPGRSTMRYDDVEVTVVVPGDRWEWAEAGAGLRRGADPDAYASTVFWLPQPSARIGTCLTERARSLGTDPDDLVGNVGPLLDLVGSTVVQGPRVVRAFGGIATHVQLRTDTGCPPDGPVAGQLRGVVDGAPFDPGWDGPHRMDAWHVLAGDASFLVVAWRLAESSDQAAERAALVESLRFTRLD